VKKTVLSRMLSYSKAAGKTTRVVRREDLGGGMFAAIVAIICTVLPLTTIVEK
jgi:hypothetical protein